MTPADLSALIAACCSGDNSAWREFTLLFHRMIAASVVRHASRAVVSRSMEDLVQEVYVRLCGDNFRRLRELRSKEHPAVAAFIRTIVLSVVYDNYRVSRAEKRGGTTAAVSYDELLRELEDTSSGAANIDRELLYEQVDRVLRSCGTEEERERNRSVFWLYYRQGLTAQEISAVPGVGLTQKGVESLLQRLSRLVKENFTGVKKENSADLRQQGRMG